MKLKISQYIDHLINNKMFDQKEVIVFGANASGSIIINQLLERGIAVSYVIDNNEQLSGTLFLEIPVLKPEELLLPKNNDVIILIASRYYEEMKAQLELMGYKENVHIFQVVNLNKQSDFNLSIETFNKHKEKIFAGYAVFESLMNKYGTDLIVMSPVRPNGDIYIICSYLNSYIQRYHQNKNYVFTVVGKSCELTAKLFNIPNIEILSEEDNENLAALSNFFPENIRVLNPYYNYQEIYHHLDGYNGLTFIQEIKHGLLNLPQGVKPEFPKFNTDYDRIEKFCQEQGVEKGKSVIIAPYANSIPLIKFTFWEELVEALKEKGFKVFTNCGIPTEEPIKGSERVFFEFADAVPVTEYAGYVICYRSGLSEIIATSKCKKIIIYPNHIKGHSTLRVLFGMEDEIYEQANLHQIVNDFSYTHELLSEVLKYIE